MTEEKGNRAGKRATPEGKDRKHDKEPKALNYTSLKKGVRNKKEGEGKKTRHWEEKKNHNSRAGKSGRNGASEEGRPGLGGVGKTEKDKERNST